MLALFCLLPPFFVRFVVQSVQDAHGEKKWRRAGGWAEEGVHPPYLSVPCADLSTVVCVCERPSVNPRVHWTDVALENGALAPVDILMGIWKRNWKGETVREELRGLICLS